MKAVVAAFNQEKALIGAFSVLTNLRMELFQALVWTRSPDSGAWQLGRQLGLYKYREDIVQTATSFNKQEVTFAQMAYYTLHMYVFLLNGRQFYTFLIWKSLKLFKCNLESILKRGSEWLIIRLENHSSPVSNTSNEDSYLSNPYFILFHFYNWW